MKLRTGKPIWLLDQARLPRARPLKEKIACDVAIVGGGISGALVAYRLLEAGLDVVLLDKRKPGLGSTAASTGLLMYQPDASIADLTRRHSRKTAQRVYSLGRQAIRDLGTLVSRLHLDCGWAPKSSLYVASGERDVTPLSREARRTHQIGFPVQRLSASQLRRRFNLPFRAALLAPGAAEVNAFTFTLGLLEHCLSHPRFRLFQPSRVTSIGEDHGGVTVRVAGGATVRARYAIDAAGYEAGKFVTSRLIKLRSTYVIASRRYSARRLAPLRCLMWETARPYFYLRTTPDHRIVFGGLDESLATPKRRDRKLPAKTRQLEEKFAALYPSLAFRAAYAWAGTFAETADGLPCIGPARRDSKILHALGYGGNGITFSQIAARIIRDICVGRSNPDASLFAFDRSRGRSRRWRRSART
jgi:glycine/D-amino acid oxidase-like deaminating enzyme